MGSEFSETDNGLKDSSHDYIKNIKSFQIQKTRGEYHQIFFRKCKKCHFIQIGLSWNGYESHGINWFDIDSDSMQILIDTDKQFNWKWHIARLKW